MLRITGAANPARIEESINEIGVSKDDDLQLPVKPQQWWLGGELSLVELIVTWARISSSPTLHTYIPADEDPTVQLRRMARRVFGFVSLMMAEEIRDRDRSPRSLRAPAYDLCRGVVEMMHRPIENFAIGSKVFLICVDHSTKAEIPWLYTPDGSVGDRESFLTLANELINRTNLKQTSHDVLQKWSQSIGAVLHELFKNTHEWARTDERNIPWRRSTRGLTAEFHTWSEADLQGIANDNPALGNYFIALRKRSGRDRLAFVELTVFDSGIGLARRWLNCSSLHVLSLNEEYTACMQCLTKHQTSSSRNDKGLGLAEVMQTLSLMSGFLKIRTGRLSLFRDFVREPLDNVNTNIDLYDFPTCQSTPTLLAPVYGTHFQLLIPLL